MKGFSVEGEKVIYRKDCPNRGSRFYARVVGIVWTLAVVGLAPGGSLARTDDPLEPETVLSPEQWEEVDRSVERALAWIATTQGSDGSFHTLPQAQPAITSLCVMAFLANGHLPGEGPYGDALERAIRFAISCQQPDGLFSLVIPERVYIQNQASHTACYNHAITGLMLCEAFGMTDRSQAESIRESIKKGVQHTVATHRAQTPNPDDRGGWRYVRLSPTARTDLSVTAWQLLFLRSANNAGFTVPTKIIDQALEYVERCFDQRRGSFVYTSTNRKIRRAMAGAGILSLSLAGLHNSDMAKDAGNWVLEHPFDHYNPNAGSHDYRFRFHYSTYYCSHGMYQLGGRYWAEFFPILVTTLLSNQNREGSWKPETRKDAMWGNVYTTALVVLALSTPNQLLPIFQR